ncbi:alpha-like surface protein [Streptococcus agalactiae]|uniref:alpha-like surface protein n=1 Tax=Streptococcus agalactiae TaxID=1311 RepID=UPI0024BA8EF7|nr:alpha-like surface protein [Streptococcus agalactiae]
MFRRSKNNSYDTSQTKQRFSIKKFKFGAASVLIGISFLGGFTQGQFNISTDTVFAAEVISGSAATLNSALVKNVSGGKAYIDIYDVKNGKIDPLNLIVLNPSNYSANYYIKQGGRIFTSVNQLQTPGTATITYNILDENGNPYTKSDGQIDIVSLVTTVYDTTELRNNINKVIENANDPKWSDDSRKDVLSKIEVIKNDIDNNPKTQSDIDNKIVEVNELEKLLVLPVPDKDKYDPTGGETTVPQGTPVSDKEITDLVKIPDGSNGVPKVVGNRPNTDVPGDYKVTVEVTYPDGTKDTVEVTVHVTPKPVPDKDKYDPTGGETTVPQGTPVSDKEITDLVKIPDGSNGVPKVVGNRPNTDVPGDYKVTVEVTYPDGTKDTVEVTVHVTPKPVPDKDKYDPTGGETTVPQGTPVSDKEITDLVKIPDGSNGVPKVVGNRPNTDVPGDYKVTVEVTYPDGTKDTVEVTVHVTPKPVPDKDKYDPTGGETTVPQGTPVSDKEITDLVKIPDGSNGVPKVVGNRPNTDVPGDYKVTVEVTYPDGTKDTVEVTVHVTPKPVPDKDKYDPTGGETTVPQGTPVSDKEITDLVKIPDGSNGVPKVVGNRPNTDVPGDYKVTVEVTYPDGTKDTVEVTVHVTPKPVPDKDKYDPTGGETTVPQGTPVSDKEITDLVKIPDGSNGVPKVVGNRPNTDVPGDYKVTVEVTYPDGTKDTVEVTVHVTPKPVPDKDKYDPTGGETTVPQGTPVSDKEITDLVKIPDGSNGVPKVVGNRPNTDVPGDYKVTVEVTYPDGTKDTVEVTVHVTPKPVPDKDKYDPTGGETTVPQGTPVSDKEITDLVKIPDGSNGVPKVVGNRPNTDVPGDYKVTVEVTVHVTPKPVPDKDKYDPTGGETTVPQGTPVSDKEITDLVKIPDGSNGVPKVVGNRPNTDVPGDYKVTVEVTYPDGTKDTVEVTVHVTPKPVPDKDKYDPTGKAQQVNGKGNKLPATGENATPFFNVAALTIISSVGLLSVSKKKED